MPTQYEKLAEHWRQQGLKISSGADERDVLSFESKNHVILPKDFRDYFMHVNGMVQDFENACDRKGFGFWPIAQIATASAEFANRTQSLPLPERPDNYFVFVDYLQWSWAYAIYLDRTVGANSIIQIGTFTPKVVAASFANFVDLYIQDAPELYVEAA